MAWVTRPHDHLGIANAIRELTKSATEFNRESVINAYLRSEIMERIAGDILH